MDLNEEYVVISKSSVQDGRGVVLVYSVVDLEFKRMIIGTGSYTNIG